jgi:hypothetical protein
LDCADGVVVDCRKPLVVCPLFAFSLQAQKYLLMGCIEPLLELETGVARNRLVEGASAALAGAAANRVFRDPKVDDAATRRAFVRRVLLVPPGVRIDVVLSDSYRHGPGAVKSG